MRKDANFSKNLIIVFGFSERISNNDIFKNIPAANANRTPDIISKT
jgi:hypothetical protein